MSQIESGGTALLNVFIKVWYAADVQINCRDSRFETLQWPAERETHIVPLSGITVVGTSTVFTYYAHIA